MRLSYYTYYISHDYILYKVFHGLGLLAPEKYEINLSNEVLNIDFGKGAAKISEFKVGGKKKKNYQKGTIF